MSGKSKNDASSSGEHSADGDPSIDELIERLMDRRDPISASEIEALLADHPRQADQLREVLPALVALAELKGKGEQQGGASASSAAGTLGDFVIKGEVGRGGMGVVYEAEQISSRRRVALKVLAAARAMDQRQLQRFRNEAAAAAQLRHPNIVRVYGTGSDRGVHYYAMEFIAGHSLEEELRHRRAMQSASHGAAAKSDETHTKLSLTRPQAATSSSKVGQVQPDNASGDSGQEVCRIRHDGLGVQPDNASGDSGQARQVAPDLPDGFDWHRGVAEIGIQVAEALDYAHTNGIVHRDIKPSNLLRDCSGKIWVTDFGLAMMETDASLTISGHLLGTPRYMSPEQARGDKRFIDHRTDVYSLGVTLYELLTLRPAFPHTEQQQVLRAIQESQPPPPRRLCPALPIDLETIVLKASAKSAAERYATAQELADDLRRFLSGRPIRARRAALLDRTRKWAARNRRLLRAAAAIGLLLLIGCGWLLYERQQRFYERQLRRQQDAVVEQGRQMARTHRYVADINRAWLAWNRGDLEPMRESLAACEPAPGEIDLRGFEWHYLKALSSNFPSPISRHEGAAYFATFSPDGAVFVTAGSDGFRCWETASGVLLKHVAAHESDVNWVSFAPDGRWLASAGDDRKVRIWDTSSWEIAHEIAGDSAVVAAEFSPAGDFLAIAERHSKGVGHNRLWLCPTGSWEQTAELSPDSSRSLQGIAFNHDGRRLAAVTGSGTCQVWDAQSGEKLHSFTRTRELHCITYDPRLDRVVVGGEDANVYLHGEAEVFAVSLKDHVARSIESLSFSRDARLLVTASRDGKAILWRQPFTSDSPAVAERVLQYPHQLWCARLSPDGRTLVVVDQEGQVYRHDLNSGYPSEPLRLQVTPYLYDGAARFLGDGNRFAIIANCIEIRDTASGRLLSRSLKDRKELTCVIANRDVSLFAVATTDGRVEFWDPAFAEQLGTWFDGEDGQVRALYISPHESLFCLKNKTLYFLPWPDRPSGTDRLEFSHRFREIVTWSPEGERAVLVDQDLHYHIWEAAQGTTIPLTGYLAYADWSEDGSMLVTLGHDGTVRLLDANTLIEKSTWIADHRGAVNCRFSPDGRTLATSGVMGDIKLWNVATGRELLRLEIDTDERGGSFGLRFAPNGRALTVERRSGVT